MWPSIASGTFSETKRQAGLLRMLQAGVILSDYATLMVEILKDNGRPEAGEVYGAMDMGWAKLVGQMPKPTESKSSADATVDASALTAYSGYGDSIRLRSVDNLVVYHADNGGVVIIVHCRDYMDALAAWDALNPQSS
jgi:hypothetical protein